MGQSSNEVDKALSGLGIRLNDSGWVEAGTGYGDEISGRSDMEPQIEKFEGTANRNVEGIGEARS